MGDLSQDSPMWGTKPSYTEVGVCVHVCACAFVCLCPTEYLPDATESYFRLHLGGLLRPSRCRCGGTHVSLDPWILKRWMRRGHL